MHVVEAEELLRLAVKAATETGALLLDRFAEPASGVDAKSSPTDLVSDADRDAEELLLELIRSERPEDGVLGEEGGQAESRTGLTWVVDPLDGTVNFLFKIPVWCVSIAVTDPHGALVGVVYNPNDDEVFTAIRGEGAYLDGEDISVGEQTDLAQALIATGFSYDAERRAEQAATVARVVPRVRDVRRLGSAALDLAYVACGRVDAFYEAPMEPWDKAAGALIAAEAGAVLSELPAPGHSPGYVVANAALHDDLRALVSA